MSIDFIGQDNLRELVLQNVAAAQFHHHPVPVEHMELHMDEGCGRSTFLRYMSEMFLHNGVREFSNMDAFLELKVPESYTELQHLIASIASYAVYTNKFTGIIGLDIEAVARHVNDAQYMNCFQQMIRALTDSALFVFFLPSTPRKQDAQIHTLLYEACDHYLVTIEAEEYSSDALLAILQAQLARRQINLQFSELKPALKEALVDNTLPKSPADVKCLVKLIHHSIIHSALTKETKMPEKV